MTYDALTLCFKLISFFALINEKRRQKIAAAENGFGKFVETSRNNSVMHYMIALKFGRLIQ